uniref:Mediator of RNA polymerase II transcription subunit 28 n=1 Tax=Theropithecus gelada TaxID=9565 RepID=A0A8D2G7V3_THEGE
MTRGCMCSGQPPGPPPPTLGFLGQAVLPQAAPGTPRPSTSTLVDELESPFEAYVSELRNELQRKGALAQKHLTKLRHWQQELEDSSVQQKKTSQHPSGYSLPMANIPAPLKLT